MNFYTLFILYVKIRSHLFYRIIYFKDPPKYFVHITYYRKGPGWLKHVIMNSENNKNLAVIHWWFQWFLCPHFTDLLY